MQNFFESMSTRDKARCAAVLLGGWTLLIVGMVVS